MVGPYIRRIDDRLAQFIQVQLCCILLMGSTLQHVTFERYSKEDALGSAVLLIILFALIILLIYHGAIFARNWYRNWQRKKALAEEVTMEANPITGAGTGVGSAGTSDSTEPTTTAEITTTTGSRPSATLSVPIARDSAIRPSEDRTRSTAEDDRLRAEAEYFEHEQDETVYDHEVDATATKSKESVAAPSRTARMSIVAGANPNAAHRDSDPPPPPTAMDDTDDADAVPPIPMLAVLNPSSSSS